MRSGGVYFELDGQDIREAARRQGRAASKELPGAIEEALTVVSYRARKAERKNAKERLDRPTPFAENSFAAAKGQRTPQGYESRLYVMAAMAGIYARLEFGGYTQRGLAIADPSVENQYGGLGPGGVKKLLRRPRTLEAKFRGVHGVYQREANGRKLTLLVSFVRHPVYEPQLGYTEVAVDAGFTFPAEVARQLEKRLKAAGYR